MRRSVEKVAEGERRIGAEDQGPPLDKLLGIAKAVLVPPFPLMHRLRLAQEEGRGLPPQNNL